MNNKIIANHVVETVRNSRRMLESRALARNMSRTYNTSIFRIYGILSYLSRTNQIIWAIKVKGGKSYLR